jgi:pyoverdine/dityrosine biosynthesis protein Dit1
MYIYLATRPLVDSCRWSESRFWDSFWKKVQSQPKWTKFGKIQMNFGLNSVNFQNLKHKIRFGLHRNGRISPKFGLSRSNSRSLIRTTYMREIEEMSLCRHKR